MEVEVAAGRRRGSSRSASDRTAALHSHLDHRRTCGDGATFPIILITAHDEPSTRERARDLKVAAYLTKPVSRLALLDAIASALRPRPGGDAVRLERSVANGLTLRGARHAAVSVARMRAVEERNMSLMGLVITLVVVGILLWLVNNYVPMDGKIKRILNVVVVIVVVIWLLQAFGLLGALQKIRIG